MGAGEVVWRTLLNFGRDTSIAGLNNAARAKGKLRTLLWLLVHKRRFFKRLFRY